MANACSDRSHLSQVAARAVQDHPTRKISASTAKAGRVQRTACGTPTSACALWRVPTSIKIAKNCRISVEMIEKYYAAHIKTRLDAAAINIMRTRKNKKGKRASQNTQASPQPPEQENGCVKADGDSQPRNNVKRADGYYYSRALGHLWRVHTRDNVT